VQPFSRGELKAAQRMIDVSDIVVVAFCNDRLGLEPQLLAVLKLGALIVREVVWTTRHVSMIAIKFLDTQGKVSQ
jgi:hypothetical protein